MVDTTGLKHILHRALLVCISFIPLIILLLYMLDMVVLYLCILLMLVMLALSPVVLSVTGHVCQVTTHILTSSTLWVGLSVYTCFFSNSAPYRRDYILITTFLRSRVFLLKQKRCSLCSVSFALWLQ